MSRNTACFACHGASTAIQSLGSLLSDPFQKRFANPQCRLAWVSPGLLSKHLQVSAPLSSLTFTLLLELMEVWSTHSQESTCHSAVSPTSSSLSTPIHSPLVSSPHPPHLLLIHPCPSCQSFLWHQKPSTLISHSVSPKIQPLRLHLHLQSLLFSQPTISHPQIQLPVRGFPIPTF